jgi:TRAP transporter 4TM/12TM fusion protein
MVTSTELPEVQTFPPQGMRQLPPWGYRMVCIAFLVFFLYVVSYVIDIFFMLGMPLFGHHKVITYGIILVFIFLLVPASKNALAYIPWYEYVLAIASLVASIYLLFNWSGIFWGEMLPALNLQVFGGIIIIATIEAARRCLGWVFAGIATFFIIYPLFGMSFPGLFFTRNFSFERITEVMYYSENGIYGSAMELFSTIMVIFFIFGAFISESKTSNLLLDSGYALTGGFRGGSAKVSILTSGLFSSISGVGAANVAATGSFTIPLMKRYGFAGKTAAAVEAAASSGGTLMPPVMGAAAFLMADFLGVPYWEIMLAALIPALLYYVALYCMVDAMAGKSGMKGIPASERPSLTRTIRDYGHFLLPISIFVLTIAVWQIRPDLSALYAIVALVLVSWLKKPTRMTGNNVRQAIYMGIFGFLKLAPAAAVVGLIMASVNMTGLSVAIVSGLRNLAADNLYLLLFYIALAAIVLGMGSSPLLVYILLFVLMVPAMVDLGIAPIAAHFFIFYFSVASLLTPPVALSVIMASGLAKSEFWPTSWEALRLGSIVFVIPFVFVLEPALLLQGSPLEVLYSITVTLAGVLLLAAGSVGFLIRWHLQWHGRLIALISAATLIGPGTATDLIGFVLFIALLMLTWSQERLGKKASPSIFSRNGESNK